MYLQCKKTHQNFFGGYESKSKFCESYLPAVVDSILDDRRHDRDKIQLTKKKDTSSN